VSYARATIGEFARSAQNRRDIMPGRTFEIYQRVDAQMGVAAQAANRYIVATDRGQGYDNRAYADSMGRKVVNGG
jgi:hypothetical protein